MMKFNTKLELGRGFQREASSFEQIMSQRSLTPFEVDRLRKVAEMININKQRVVVLCEATGPRESSQAGTGYQCAVGKSQNPCSHQSRSQQCRSLHQRQELPTQCLHHL